MTELKNIGKTSAKGRPFKDPVSKYRTLLWYWAVSQKSGLSDGKLDIEFSDPEPDGNKRSYGDRIRIFEDIRKSGATISDGEHKRRNFDLIKRVNSHHNFAGSADLYQSIFWEILADTKPTTEKSKANFFKLIKICELSTIEFHSYLAPTEYELKELSKQLQMSPDEIKEKLEPEIFTNESKAYSEILQNFSNVTHFVVIREVVDFEKISDYLNILAFYISLYRYTMQTANYHALISTAESINEHLSLLLFDFKWLPKGFTRELMHLIYQRVFYSSNKYELINLDINTLDNTLKDDSALCKLFELLNK